ncbi:50S ribosomal protein L6 [Candidatus Magnetominusculus xianensis]|uniref:Large ribosomal subunit protein uL6 n=1 Tax=Candidatus Magnetominusculus xianensis TaxID=1748249 RepID=A0ABR5SF35_9BACT|nr:50S ribosomal protein L6 [Candidatus Magnetominusculus xianensis]KWT83409.1 50S ribosomal protein L6 [Candidatus Magnetominusculus xianensis]MBF0403519.1 50S ribosomal protein L6 [Nitrospirota bacterium]
MSRVGKKPIEIPGGVTVTINGSAVAVKGAKGELSWSVPDLMKLVINGNILTVERAGDTKNERSLHGLTRSLLSSMCEGVSKGFTRDMELVGVGYRAQVKDDKIEFAMGYSHPVIFQLPKGITAEVDKKQTKLTLRGIDKQLLGQMAANIRGIRPPDAYKGKGIRYANESIKLKPGKTGTK